MTTPSLRVLLILENAGSGSGRHVLDLARGLLAHGAQVTLLYSASRLEGWFARELAEVSGLRNATLDMRPGLGPRDVVTIGQVRRFLREQGPFDVVHGHSSKGGALARLAARGQPGICVYTPHAFYTLGASPGAPAGRFYAVLERLLARWCDGIVCVSAAEAEHAATVLRLPTSMLFTVPNGLDKLPPTDRAAVRERYGLAAHHVCVGFVGRLARQKAVHRLLDAFALAHAERPDARLMIVGFGPDEAALRGRARDLDIDDAVIWTGEANGVQMMSAFDVFALPSLYEAFPYVLLEAMATGLPIVSTRVGGVRELVYQDQNGYVVEQDDTPALACRLRQLLGDDARRAAMGTASREIVAGFDVDAMVTRTLDVYRTLIERRAARA